MLVKKELWERITIEKDHDQSNMIRANKKNVFPGTDSLIFANIINLIFSAA